MSMTNGKYNLVCVAHPDDETIFFGGLLLNPKRDTYPWVVVCVTSDGNSDRRRQFAEACAALGVKETQWWAFPDKYEQRLPISDMVDKLSKLPPPNEIFTHGIVGEYGHPHHQDVSYAVHKAFRNHAKLYSVAYNAFPEIEVKLTPEQFECKSRILTKVYGSETSRFLNVLPSTFVEGFTRISSAEVEAIYDFLAKGQPLREADLKAYRALIDYLPHLRGLPRPF